MDVGAALVTDGRAAETGEPRQGTFHHPAVSAKPLASLAVASPIDRQETVDPIRAADVVEAGRRTGTKGRREQAVLPFAPRWEVHATAPTAQPIPLGGLSPTQLMQQ